ncbi:PKD domain-containing protein [Ammoniphilus resinae]|uniref:PKD/Chitinase domain-containing protein n=1 Tax=Ammoniphilus resinae TaxID=861532 RepID=A0ABS4GNH3_9BACL|nr:PKD domain-containing protein [Ammoniphilus resinae]MBP1931823.1 hypothetical protein [Ammoniphilus resinae]
MPGIIKIRKVIAVFMTAIFLMGQIIIPLPISASVNVQVNNGQIFFSTQSKKASSGIRYRTTGWIVHKARANGNPTSTAHGKMENMQQVSESDGPSGTVITDFLILIDVVSKAMNDAGMESTKDRDTIYLSSIFQIIENGKLLPQKYYSKSAIVGARSWANPSDFDQFYDIPVSWNSGQYPVRVVYKKENGSSPITLSSFVKGQYKSATAVSHTFEQTYSGMQLQRTYIENPFTKDKKFILEKTDPNVQTRNFTVGIGGTYIVAEYKDGPPPPAPEPTKPPVPSGNIYVDFDMPPSGETNTTIPITQISVPAKCGYSNGLIKEYKWTVSPSSGFMPSTGSWPGWNNKVSFYSAGTYTVTLWAKDNCGNEGTKTKTITIGSTPVDPPPPPQPENIPPVAKVRAPSSVNIGKPVTIDGSGSYDPDFGPSPLDYSWKISPKNGFDGDLEYTGGTLTFNEEGTYVIKLTVDDGEDSDTDEREIEVENKPPRAIIDMPSTVIQGDEITIENRSYDPNGDQITVIKWTIPPDANMKDPITDQPVTTLNDDKTKVYFDTPGEYEFKLYVEDEWGKPDEVTEKITVKPAIPTAYYVIAPGSYPKENRKMELDATQSTTSKRYPIVWSKTEWEFVPPTGVSLDQVKWVDDGDLSIHQTLFKKAGIYKIRLRVTNTAGNTSPWYERSIEIMRDTPPHVDFYVASAIIRDSDTRKAAISLTDLTQSDDQDIISKRVWKYKFDSDNDGDFLDENWIILDNGNNPNPILYTDKVGNYLFELEVEEEFGQPTIPQFITAEDKRKGDTTAKPMSEKKSEVINLRPMVSFAPIFKKKADIVFTVGQVEQSKVADLNGMIATYMKSKFASTGIDAEITSIETTQLAVENNFAWVEYSHSYTDSAYSGSTSNGVPTTNHIVKNGKDLTFYGYDAPGYKDFLFMPNNVKSKKTFRFQVNENQTDWHTLEGAGYLFNTQIVGDTLSGYAILLAQTGIKLYQIPAVNVNQFHEGVVYSVASAGMEIGSYPKTSNQHDFVIEVTPDKIDLWDNGVKLIDGKALPEQYGNGFGPMASYVSHGCSSLSYITFKNIEMETISGRSFDEVLKEPTWRDGAFRFVANISDVEIPEFNDPQKQSVIYSRMLNNVLDFSGLGTNANQSQIRRIIGINNGNGTFINNTRMDQAISNYADYIIAKINANSGLSNYILLDQEINFETFYEDVERDPEIARRWKFDHTNPNYFQNSLGRAPYHDQWLPNSVNKFSHVGEFDITFQAKDEPRYNNGTFDNRFDNYRLWSWEPEKTLKLFVHRKSIANFSPVLSPSSSTKPTSILEDFEDTNYNFSFSGSWGRNTTRKSGGNYSYKSGSTGHSSSSTGSTTFTIPAQAKNARLSFDWYVSSETNYDYLTISLNGNNIVNVSGNQGWVNYKQALIPGTTYNLQFTYRKDGSGSVGDDAGYIDNLSVYYEGVDPLSYGLSIRDYSYDIDHEYEANKGIVQREWKWKEDTATTWTAGMPPSTLNAGKTILIYLRVKDPEGVWSDPDVKVVTTSGNIPPVAVFTPKPNPLPLSQSLSYEDLSYDPNGDPIVGYRWRSQPAAGGAWTDHGISPGGTSFANTAPKKFGKIGEYRIELTVQDNKGAWSEPYYQVIKVIAENKPPIALFDLLPGYSIPQDVPMSYRDRSYDQDTPPDPLVAWEWRMKKTTDTNWTTISEPPSDLSGYAPGSYQIQLRVKDQPALSQLTPLWSNWFERIVTISPKNQKPVANLSVSPNPSPADEQVTWIDRSTDPEGKNLDAYEMRITQLDSGVSQFFSNNYSKPSGAAMDMSSRFIQIFETSSFPNDGVGTYRIEYRVRDQAPNNLGSPQLWSDWQVQTFVVEDALRIIGGVEPPVARSGQAIKLTANTEGKAQQVVTRIDWNRDGDFNDEGETISLKEKYPTTSKANEWEEWVIIPLPTADGVYSIEYEAIKPSPSGPPKSVTDYKTITIVGDIFQDYFMEYYK